MQGQTIIGAAPPQSPQGVEDFLARQNAVAVHKKPVARPQAPRRSLLGLGIAVIAGVVAGVMTVVVIENVRGHGDVAATPTTDALTIGPAEVTTAPPPPSPAAPPAQPSPKPAIAAVPPAPAKTASSSSAKKPRRARAATPPTKTMSFSDPEPSNAPTTAPTDPDAPLPH